MTATPTFVSLRYSPWSERAHWALDHHGLAYELVRHQPFIGERKLRKLAGRRTGRVTAPLLLAGGERLMDGFEIARWADRHGSAEPLVPAAREREIAELSALAERGLEAGRVLVTAALLADDVALDELLPGGVPRPLRPALRAYARFGTRWFARKYSLSLGDLAASRRALAKTLERFRERYGARPYLFERFSFADISFCALLQGVSPVDDRYLRLRPGRRRTFTQPALAAEFADLVARRDRLYAEHRPERVRPVT